MKISIFVQKDLDLYAFNLKQKSLVIFLEQRVHSEIKIYERKIYIMMFCHLLLFYLKFFFSLKLQFGP